jgi:DNA-binding transcriptional LysR family regulator
MELRQLRYFVAVVEANGLRKAARDLYIAPSALSRSLQQLEREHGVALLRRSACGVEPTTAGRDLLDHARLILERADAATTATAPSSARDTHTRTAVDDPSAVHPQPPPPPRDPTDKNDGFNSRPSQFCVR